MWGTSQGDRTLIGDEARIVRKSVGYLRDVITAGIDLAEPNQSPVGVFNRPSTDTTTSRSSRSRIRVARPFHTDH